MTSGTMISASTGLPVSRACRDGTLENGPRLHLGDLRIRDSEPHAAEPQHGIELMQVLGTALHLFD